jgi:hypothetical protein
MERAPWVISSYGCGTGTIREPNKGGRLPLEAGARALVWDTRQRGLRACEVNSRLWELAITIYRLQFRIGNSAIECKLQLRILSGECQLNPVSNAKTSRLSLNVSSLLGRDSIIFSDVTYCSLVEICSRFSKKLCNKLPDCTVPYIER